MAASARTLTATTLGRNARKVNLSMNSLPRSAANVNPLPMDDESIGWRSFFAGRLISECHNLEQRAGWLAACTHARNVAEVL